MMPLSQDHKRLLENDQGPNTGGMGAYTPLTFVDENLRTKIEKDILLRTVQALKKEGIVYKGTCSKLCLLLKHFVFKKKILVRLYQIVFDYMRFIL